MIYSSGGLSVQAATPAAGFALQNATPNIITWTAPADGKNHRFILIGQTVVTSLNTGGQITLTYTDPAGNAHTQNQYNGGGGAQVLGFGQVNGNALIIQAGSAVTLAQASALTGGTTTVWAEIWGS